MMVLARRGNMKALERGKKWFYLVDAIKDLTVVMRGARPNFGVMALALFGSLVP